MTTDSIVVVIYHCLSCGEIRGQEGELPVPVCCDRPMAKAAQETVAAVSDLSTTAKEAHVGSDD